MTRFHLFHGQVTAYCILIPSLLILLLTDRHCYHILTIVNNAAINSGDTYHFKLVFSFSSDKYQEVDFLGYVVFQILSFWKTWTVFQCLYHFIFPPTAYEGSLFSTSLPIVFLIISILTDIGSYLVLICIFLMIWDVKHLSFVSWPSLQYVFFGRMSICFLWKNVYSGPLPIL